MTSVDTVRVHVAEDSWRVKLEDALHTCQQGLTAAKERHQELQRQVLDEEKYLVQLQQRLSLAEQLLRDFDHKPAAPKRAENDADLVGFSFGFSPVATVPKTSVFSPGDDIAKLSFKENAKQGSPAERSFAIPPMTPTRRNRPDQSPSSLGDAPTMVSSLSIQEPASSASKEPSPDVRPDVTLTSPSVRNEFEPVHHHVPPLRTIPRSATVGHVHSLSNNSVLTRASFGEDGSGYPRSRVSSSHSNRDLRSSLTRTESTISTASETSMVSVTHPLLDRLTEIEVEIEIGLLGKLPTLLRLRGDPVVVLKFVDGDTTWWAAKTYSQLSKLEGFIRPYCTALGMSLPPFPDKSLYSNQTPENVDQRNDMFRAFINQVHSIGEVKRDSGKPLPLSVKRAIGNFFLSDTVELASKSFLRGYLLRKGRFGGWKVRYFSVNGSFLDVYDRMDSPPVESIKLRGARVHFVDPPAIGNTDERHAFEIIDQNKRRALFCADTAQNREQWVSGLSEVAAKPMVRSSIVPTPLPFTTTKGPAVFLGQQSKSLSVNIDPDNRRPSTGEFSAASSGSNDTDDYSLISSSSSGPLAAARSPDFKGPVQPLNTSWRASAGKYDSSRPRRVFGARVEHTVKIAAREYHGTKLPAVLVRCLEVLSTEEALSEEGLFRITGSQSTIDRIESYFEEKGDYDLISSCTDVHVVATLLKRYLRSLPDSFLPLVDEPTLRTILDSEISVRSAELMKITQRLPDLLYSVLYCVIALLVNVTAFQKRNKMSSRNVSIVFSPSLNVPSGVALAWIENFNDIFVNRN